MGQTEQLLNDWLRHRNVLEELLKLIGEEHINFQPWDGSMTLGELTLHIVQWNDVFVSFVKTGEFVPPNKIECNTMTALRQTVHELTEKTSATFATVTDADLEAERVFGTGFQGTGKMFLTMMYDHEIHHKGQLFVYARMVGVQEPPFFRDFK